MIKGRLLWQGNEVDKGAILNFGAGKSFDSVSDSKFYGYTISIAEPVFEKISDQLGISLENSIDHAHILHPRDNNQNSLGLASRIRRFLHGYYSETQSFSSEEDTIVTLLGAMTQSDRHEDKSSAMQRSRALAGALEVFDAYSDSILPLTTVCETVGVSIRTLNRAFNETFGMGPKAYLLTTRLSQIRNELLKSDKSVKVADVANRWGFWHMGQLARDYRKQFGELPSETLQFNGTVQRTR